MHCLLSVGKYATKQMYLYTFYDVRSIICDENSQFQRAHHISSLLLFILPCKNNKSQVSGLFLGLVRLKSAIFLVLPVLVLLYGKPLSWKVAYAPDDYRCESLLDRSTAFPAKKKSLSLKSHQMHTICDLLLLVQYNFKF